MGALLVIGLVWLVGTILYEEIFIKPVPKGTDFHQAYIDAGKISKAEYKRRLDSGYYVKKD